MPQAKTKEGAFQPLSLKEKELIVKEVLGVHPKYLIKSGLKLVLDISKLQADGENFQEWQHTEHYYRTD